MEKEQLVYKLALAMVPGIGAGTARALMARFQTAEKIFKSSRRELVLIPGIGTTLADRILRFNSFARVEEEIRFTERDHIGIRFLFDEEYPPLLSNCPDAPIIIFFKGRLPDKGQRTLSIVGTRHPTVRGKEITKNIVREIAEQDPSVIIISGLAYGIDIQAHIAALDSGLQTIAVLGHGFHTLYPAIHRDTARRITTQGGLITDFFSHNLMEPKNFIRRNRIIAGLAEATLVIESGIKGGAIVTAEMAVSYDRDLYSVPGRPDDGMSKGSNYLIRSSQATLVQSGEELMISAGWLKKQVSRQNSQPELFTTLEPDEKKVFDMIGTVPSSLDQVSRETNLPVQMVSAIALSLEFKGLIHGLPGQQYFR